MNELQISDGKILSFTSDLQGLKLVFQDWKEKKWALFFHEVLAVQSISIEGEELSHLAISKDDEFKRITLEYFLDEEANDFNCYNFFGVWRDSVLLKIVAKDNYKIEPID